MSPSCHLACALGDLMVDTKSTIRTMGFALPLIFSQESRLPVIQRGFSPREQPREGGVLTRAEIYPRETYCPTQTS